MFNWLSPRMRKKLKETEANIDKLNELLVQYEKLTSEQTELIDELNRTTQLHVKLSAEHEALIQEKTDTIHKLLSANKSLEEQLKDAKPQDPAIPSAEPNTPW